MSSPNAHPPRSSLDLWISAADTALRTLGNAHTASRTPTSAASDSSNEASPLSDEERRLSASLMRVNHVGEVCAQALYNAQALATRNAALKEHFEHAAREEADHLAWTHQRLSELNSRTSLLNPLWYAGAFTIGWLAGRVGDGVSLGFVVETERQVEEHLASHMERLPAGDTTSRTIVRQMKDDEARHGAAARQAGALDLPLPVQWAMRAAAKVMTTTAHYV